MGARARGYILNLTRTAISYTYTLRYAKAKTPLSAPTAREPCRLYRVPPVRDPGRPGEWSVTVNYGLMLTSGAKTKVTTRFLVKNYPYDMFGRYSRYIAVT